MIGDLGTDLAAGEDIQRVHGSFDAMIAFARTHFATEEALMERYAIEDRLTHQQMHRKLLQDARSLATSLDEPSMMLVMGSLHEWLLRHIDSADKALARKLEAERVRRYAAVTRHIGRGAMVEVACRPPR